MAEDLPSLERVSVSYGMMMILSKGQGAWRRERESRERIVLVPGSHRQELVRSKHGFHGPRP